MKDKNWCTKTYNTCGAASATDWDGVLKNIQQQFPEQNVEKLNFNACIRHRSFNIGGIWIDIALKDNFDLEDCRYSNNDILKVFDIVFVITYSSNEGIYGMDIKRGTKIQRLRDVVDKYIEEAKKC